MVTDELITFIQSQFKQSVAPEVIKKSLLQNGWKKEEIDQAFQNPQIQELQQKLPPQPANKMIPWPIFWIYVVSVLTSYAGSYLITWQSLKRIGKDDVANRFLLIGGVITLVISYLTRFIPSQLFPGYNGLPGVAAGLASIFPLWFQYKYFNQWQKDNPNQTKFTWSIVGWGILGIILLVIIELGISFITMKNNKQLQFHNSNPVSTNSITLSTSPTYLPSPTPESSPSANISAYVDNDYNFQFSYPLKGQNCSQSDGYCTQYNVLKNGNIITFYSNSSSPNSSPQKLTHATYTLYSANVTDKDNLTQWWKSNIIKEPDNPDQSSSYTFQPNSWPFDGCISGVQWTRPHSVEVDWTENGSPLNYSSVYFYYNFGKPFIMRLYMGGSSGACPSINELLPITSISKLK